MTPPNQDCAEKAAKRIVERVEGILDYLVESEAVPYIAAIIEDITRVKEKEEALRAFLKEFGPYQQLRYCTNELKGEGVYFSPAGVLIHAGIAEQAQCALDGKPEKDLLEPYRNVVNKGGSYKPEPKDSPE